MRGLTELEQKVFEFMQAHPAAITFDIAKEFGQTDDVYYAIAYVNAYVMVPSVEII